MSIPRRNAFRLLAIILTAALVGSSASLAQDEPRRPSTRPSRDAKKDELTLERIFPERSFFGPSASSAAFSHDGRFAAYLYRPYDERRHGSDLYIYDTQTGQSRRVTSASRMAEFQAGARNVVEDRTKKAKEAKLPRVAEIEARDKKDKAQDEDAKEKSDDAATTQAAEQSAPDRTAELLGSYGAQIGESSDPGKIEPGASSRLVIRREGDAVIGTFHAGLVRLPLRGFKLEGDTATATVGDGEDGLDGVLEATFSAALGTLAGTVTLSSPELDFSFEARRDEKAAAGDAEPPAVAQEAAKLEDAERSERESPAAGAPSKREYARGILEVEGEDLELGDLVTQRDGEDQRGARYGGIQSFEWSPKKSEMLVLSEGDIYLLKVDPARWQEADEKQRPYRGDLERLTRTRERESRVAFLPDGTGYTYLRSDALLRVSFGDHSIVQLDPPLGPGERMTSYRISPDTKRLVFLAERQPGERASQEREEERQDEQRRDGERRQIERGDEDGDEQRDTGRRVTLVTYRDRFARVREVPRQVADDEQPPVQVAIYLYDLEGHAQEKGKPRRVLTRTVTGPRDVMFVPHFSPDSKKVAFSAFEQESGKVLILEADFETKAESEQATPATEPARSGFGGRRQRQEEREDGDQEGAYDEFHWDLGPQDRLTRPTTSPTTQPAQEQPVFKVEGAKIVYQFLHNGGPNTPRMIIPQYLADSRHLVFVTELSGFRQLHVLDPVYERLEQITQGTNEVYPFHISRDHKNLFVTATVEGDPAQEWVYRIDLATRQMKRMCAGEGVLSRPAVSDDGNHLLALKVDFGAPQELVAFDCSGEESVETVLSDFHPEEAHKLTSVKPEYFTFQNRHGHTIHGHMFKPKDWTAEDKRPLLIYVYGGPLGTQNQISRGSYAATSYLFARYMAEKHGWVTATVDPRGTSGFGAVFEKANFEQVGKPQTEDLVDAAEWLAKNAGVDPKRRALHGWSFGGFQTQMTMYSEPEAFAAGIAGAGPTEWQNYNSWYTTGTVAPRDAFKQKLDQFSLLPLAKNLKGRLLLVHGVEDSNVLYQDTIRVYRELLRGGKEHLVDLFIDPTGGHGLGGDVKTIGRYRKYEDFLLTYVGKGSATARKDDSLEGEKPPVAETAAARTEAPPKE